MDYGFGKTYTLPGKFTALNGCVQYYTLVFTNVSLTEGEDAQANGTYYGDFSNTAGLVMGKGAIGTIVRKGITVETTWLPTELCWLLTARNLQGHGILDPRKAVEIRDEAA